MSRRLPRPSPTPAAPQRRTATSCPRYCATSGRGVPVGAVLCFTSSPGTRSSGEIITSFPEAGVRGRLRAAVGFTTGDLHIRRSGSPCQHAEFTPARPVIATRFRSPVGRPAQRASHPVATCGAVYCRDAPPASAATALRLTSTNPSVRLFEPKSCASCNCPTSQWGVPAVHRLRQHRDDLVRDRLELWMNMGGAL